MTTDTHTSTAARPYRLGAREASTAETRRRILESTFTLVNDGQRAQLVLADVAAHAGSTVQTILRHFGSREGLFVAALEFASDEVAAERETPVGDVRRAISTIVSHYEKRGDTVFRWLLQEFSDVTAARMTEAGKQLHRDWVEAAFEPHLRELSAAKREESVDLVVVATDLFTWKLLRRDRGLSVAVVEARMLTLVSLVLENPQ